MSASPPNPDDPLARAEAALRRSGVAEGPSEESLAQALAVARAAEGRPGVVPWNRRRIMVSMMKVAAVVVAAGSLFYVSRPPKASATVFQEAAQKLHDARAIVYRATSSMEGAPPGMNPLKMKLYFREPKRMRVETDMAGGAGPVSIYDGARGRMLVLDAARKTAVVMDVGDAPKDFVASTIEELRNLPGKDGKPVGRERIGDVDAEGFRVEKPGGSVVAGSMVAGSMVAWIDPKTRVPLRIDVTDKVGDKDIRATLTDFAIDPPLDEALFRVEPPEGFAVQRVNGGVIFDKPEVAVVRVLRAFAEQTGGTFPTRLDDMNGYKALKAAFPEERKDGNVARLEPKALELAMSLGRVMVLRNELKGYGYKADGVKLGDANKIVFWYRPEGSDKYRAVYGDLHVGDVEAGALPELPKP
jgi:outer membrane lipoprotein-sorting protein